MSVKPKSKFIEMKQALPTSPPLSRKASPRHGEYDFLFLSVVAGSGGSILVGIAAVALVVGLIAAAVGALYVACWFITVLPIAYLNFNAFGRRIVNMRDSTTLIQLIKGIVVSIAISEEIKLNENQVLNQQTLNAYIFKLNRNNAPRILDKFKDVAEFYNNNVTTKGELYKACGKYVNMAVFVRNKNKHYKLRYPFKNEPGRKWLLLVDDNPDKDDDIRAMGILTKETSLWGGTFEPRLIIHEWPEVESLLAKYKPDMDHKSVPQVGEKEVLSTKPIVNNAHKAKKPNIAIHKAKRVLGRVKKVFKILKNDGATLSRTGTYTLNTGPGISLIAKEGTELDATEMETLRRETHAE